MNFQDFLDKLATKTKSSISIDVDHSKDSSGDREDASYAMKTNNNGEHEDRNEYYEDTLGLGESDEYLENLAQSN